MKLQNKGVEKKKEKKPHPPQYTKCPNSLKTWAFWRGLVSVLSVLSSLYFFSLQYWLIIIHCP